MSTVLLIIQLIISVVLTGLILIQRSEGGALGIGGGGGGGLMSGRSATTSIARVTGILGAIFIVNCLALSVVYQMENEFKSVLDTPAAEESVSQPLTAPSDSSDETAPLADETPAQDSPENEPQTEDETAPEADGPEK